ncbi:MAG TPA: cation diffusion facilitator family transporter [Dehalococcoidia bacterium]|jgi:cation diffusion facilitator family transporter|nr:cation diffusion facilitator family transporter [Dehalococcoidia bacterium]
MTEHAKTPVPEAPPHGGEESRGAVLAAMAANFLIACGKFVAGALTGSAAMFAEAGHSVADTVNQVFLLLGINLSRTKADESHPLGYGKEAFFWSFLAAIFIFVAGAAFSFYEGTRTLIQEEAHERSSFDLAVAFVVLGMAVLFELFSFTVAMRSLVTGARRKGWSVPAYIRRSPDLTLKTVFFEDSAALTGLVLAAGGLTLSEVAHDEVWDGIASVSIGFVLAAVSVMLGLQARNLLLGAAASGEVRTALHRAVTSFPEVIHIVRLLSMQLGSHSVLVTGELEVSRGLNTDQIEDLLARIDQKIATTVPDVTETFWELRRRR